MTNRTGVTLVAAVVLTSGSALAQGPIDPVAYRSLKALMPAYGVATHRIQNALWRDDYATVADQARRIAAHSGFSEEHVVQIAGTAGEDAARFGQADALVHRSALALVLAAEEKNALKAVKALGSMQEGCAACHSNYRSKLLAK